MDREAERIMKQLIRYLEDHEKELDEGVSEEELADRFFAEYRATMPPKNVVALPQTADDYIELAGEAGTKKKKLEYLARALELEPDNLDAALMDAQCRAKKPEELLEQLDALIRQGDAQMKRGGYFKNCMGEFWGVTETRPYMRLRWARLEALTACGMMRRAVEDAQAMLRLCRDDNLGARYMLMHLYVFFEEKDRALALLKQYREEGDAPQMLLPLAVLYYKMGDFARSLEYLERLNRENKDTKKFLRAVVNGSLDTYLTEMSPIGYQPFTIEELIFEYMDHMFLFDAVPTFFDWASRSLKKPAGRPAKK